MGFLFFFENVPCKSFIVEKMEFGMTPKQCGIHFKPQPLLQKTSLIYASETLTTYARMCLCTHALVCVRMPRATLVI